MKIFLCLRFSSSLFCGGGWLLAANGHSDANNQIIMPRRYRVAVSVVSLATALRGGCTKRMMNF